MWCLVASNVVRLTFDGDLCLPAFYSRSKQLATLLPDNAGRKEHLRAYQTAVEELRLEATLAGS